MSRTTHHTPWRRRDDVTCCAAQTTDVGHGWAATPRHGDLCAAVTHHAVTTLRRPRQVRPGEVGAVVEVTTAYEVFSYGRAFRPESARQARVLAEGVMRTRQVAALRTLTGLANAALADGDTDELEDLDGYVAPAPIIRGWW